MDWNNDGKIDLLTGEADGYIRLYLNTGTASEPSFSGFSYLQLGNAVFDCGNNSRPFVVDWDSDGRKDVLCGSQGGDVQLLLNVGSDSKPAFQSAVSLSVGSGPVSVPGRASPVAFDWNRDGKKDLLVGDGEGQVRYFENVGTDGMPVLEAPRCLSVDGSVLDVGYEAAPSVADWNNDGEPDLICGSISDRVSGNVWLYPSLRGVGVERFRAQDQDLDGYLEPGEGFSLLCTLRNAGASVRGLQAVLQSTTPFATVVQSGWAVGDLAAGAIASNTTAPFLLTLSSNAPLASPINLELRLSDASGTLLRTAHLALITAAPELSVEYYVDDSLGDGNGAPSLGERCRLVVRLANTGYGVEGAVAQISAWATPVAWLNDQAVFGTIPQGGSALNQSMPLCFETPISSSALGYYGFDLQIRCDRGYTTNLSLWAYSGDYSCYSWFDSEWYDTTGGTALTLADEGWQVADLGFPFPFFGSASNSVYIHANGYLSLGTPSLPRENGMLPGGLPSHGIIAPFWDDLDPSAGGTIRYRRGGSAPWRDFTVEWAGVPRRGDPGCSLKFQVTLSEDGSIVFRYRDLVGLNADGRSATIGLESPSGRLGYQYACNWAASISSGLRVTYQLPWIPGDGDHDRLPDDYEWFWFRTLDKAGIEDDDRDGRNNYEEFCSGSNPTDPACHLRLRELTLLGADRWVVRWQSCPFTAYDVYQLTSVGSTNWTLLTPAPIRAVGSSSSFTGLVRQAAGAVFLRVGAPQPGSR